jgi:hypothetical protein
MKSKLLVPFPIIISVRQGGIGLSQMPMKRCTVLIESLSRWSLPEMPVRTRTHSSRKGSFSEKRKVANPMLNPKINLEDAFRNAVYRV